MTNKKVNFITVNTSLVVAAVLAVMSFGLYALVVNVFPYGLGLQRHEVEVGGGFDYTETKGEFHGRELGYLGRELVSDTGEYQGRVVLGTEDKEVTKRIEVDLEKQRLFAIENGEVIGEFPVSTGKWGRTPTGTYRIWVKYVATKMEGGSRALNTYYYLPNVPYTMYFYNSEISKSRGYGIHGAYWHSNFGEVMSHGCINMRTRDVEKLFYWAGPDIGEAWSGLATGENPGTEVVIY